MAGYRHHVRICFYRFSSGHAHSQARLVGSVISRTCADSSGDAIESDHRDQALQQFNWLFQAACLLPYLGAMGIGGTLARSWRRKCMASYEIDRERWAQLSIFEQLGNIGAEVRNDAAPLLMNRSMARRDGSQSASGGSDIAAT